MVQNIVIKKSKNVNKNKNTSVAILSIKVQTKQTKRISNTSEALT